MTALPRILPATLKLFHQDATLGAAPARVVACAGRDLVLDQTIFYAESGGQVTDTGTIDGVAVVDVAKTGGTPVKIERPGLSPIYVNKETVFVHRMAEERHFQPGQGVSLVLEVGRRQAIARYHGAAHFLFEAIDAVLGERQSERIFTRSCRIAEDGCRFDLGNRIDPGMVAEIEARANAMIGEGGSITMTPDPSCDDVFYWRCGDLVIPCGGTHVTSAREIPPITLSRRSKGASNIRLQAVFA